MHERARVNPACVRYWPFNARGSSSRDAELIGGPPGSARIVLSAGSVIPRALTM